MCVCMCGCECMCVSQFMSLGRDGAKVKVLVSITNSLLCYILTKGIDKNNRLNLQDVWLFVLLFDCLNLLGRGKYLQSIRCHLHLANGRRASVLRMPSNLDVAEDDWGSSLRERGLRSSLPSFWLEVYSSCMCVCVCGCSGWGWTCLPVTGIRPLKQPQWVFPSLSPSSTPFHAPVCHLWPSRANSRHAVTTHLHYSTTFSLSFSLKWLNLLLSSNLMFLVSIIQLLWKR